MYVEIYIHIYLYAYMREAELMDCDTAALKHCNTLQHTATHCNTLQHTATSLNLQISRTNEQY